MLCLPCDVINVPCSPPPKLGELGETLGTRLETRLYHLFYFTLPSHALCLHFCTIAWSHGSRSRSIHTLDHIYTVCTSVSCFTQLSSLNYHSKYHIKPCYYRFKMCKQCDFYVTDIISVYHIQKIGDACLANEVAGLFFKHWIVLYLAQTGTLWFLKYNQVCVRQGTIFPDSAYWPMNLCVFLLASFPSFPEGQG